jgi:hypothetical protein
MGAACGRPTRVGDVIPVGGVELIFRFEDLFKELGVIFVIKRRIAAEPGRQDGVRSEWLHSQCGGFVLCLEERRTIEFRKPTLCMLQMEAQQRNHREVKS